jgi:uncharacterized protein YndB with AHSA1/START domain
MVWLWIPIGVVAGLVVVVGMMALIGLGLPQGHVAARRARFRQPPEGVWAAITDVDAFPSWRPDVKRIERLPERDGRPVWREVGRHGPLTMEQLEAQPPWRLVGRIADPALPFGGTWTYDIVAVEGGSLLTIRENGEVYNPLFRFLARFVFGHHGTLELYLKSLGRKFGETVVPEPAGRGE